MSVWYEVAPALRTLLIIKGTVRGGDVYIGVSVYVCVCPSV